MILIVYPKVMRPILFEKPNIAGHLKVSVNGGFMSVKKSSPIIAA
jgi:hypothetical protein